MSRLYEAEVLKEADLKGLPDPDGTLKKIILVGDLACREGADLLESCVAPILDHFRPICKIERVRSNLENYWELKFRVAPRRWRGKRFTIGVTLDYAPNPTALLPWVYCSGGRRGGDELHRLLKQRGTKGSELLGWSSCNVFLPPAIIPIPDRLDEAIPREPLIDQIRRSFATVTPDEIKEMAQLRASFTT